MNPDQYDLVKGLIESIEAIPDAEPFSSPVDWKELELKDYPDIIKHPMDLGTLKNNLLSGVYTTIDACFKDL